MPDEMKQCCGCERQIPAHLLARYCKFCQSKLNGEGKCAHCGEKPVKRKTHSGRPSKNCLDCGILLRQQAAHREAESEIMPDVAQAMEEQYGKPLVDPKLWEF